MGELNIEIRQVFEGDRFPNIVVAADATVSAVWGGIMVRRREDGGETLYPEIPVGNRHTGDGITVNETNEEIFTFVGKANPSSTNPGHVLVEGETSFRSEGERLVEDDYVVRYTISVCVETFQTIVFGRMEKPESGVIVVVGDSSTEEEEVSVARSCLRIVVGQKTAFCDRQVRGVATVGGVLLGSV